MQNITVVLQQSTKIAVESPYSVYSYVTKCKKPEKLDISDALSKIKKLKAIIKNGCKVLSEM